MATKSKSAVVVDKRRIEVQEFSLPEIGEDDGLLRVEITGVCGSDYPVYTGDDGGRTPPPVILGHEIVGRVERLGARAAERWSVKEGDRVAMEEFVPCGRCYYCLTGHYNNCGNRPMMLGHVPTTSSPSLWGGYSEYLYLDPRSVLYKLSDSVPLEVAPLYLPMGNGVRWVQSDGGARIGSTVAILGPGHVGMGCVAAAKEAGASCVIVTGLSADANRFGIAKALGADYTINIEEEHPVKRVSEITNGAMADTVVNVTASAPGAVQQAIDLAGHGGTIVQAGVAHARAEISIDEILRKELHLKGCRARHMTDVLKGIKVLESGKYPLEKTCTHQFSIEETAEAIQTVGREGDPESLAVAVVPG